MAEHLIDGEFQSDKYPTCPRGKVPLSCKDVTAQDLLWEYAQRHRPVDGPFADDLESALMLAGYEPPPRWRHLKRGTEYTVIETATAQSAEPIREGERVEVYQSEYGMRELHVRRKTEFHDGRFERLHADSSRE
jgi:hypothetical protein